jgi:uncharacterized repeat protein (TIGR01451 family)
MRLHTLIVAACSAWALVACGGGGSADPEAGASTASNGRVKATSASGETYIADVSVTGTGPNAAVPGGDTAVYTMVVSNAGPDAAQDVGIVNTVDANQALGTITCAARSLRGRRNPAPSPACGRGLG